MNHLPLPLSLFAAVAAAFAGYAYGSRLHRQGFSLTARITAGDCPLIPTALLLFVVIQVCTSTFLENPHIGWWLPLPVEYYLTPAMWLLKILFVAFAMAALATVGIRQPHPQRTAIALFGVLVVVLVELLNRWATQPQVGEIDVKMKDGVVLQTNDATCAAASAANIARYFGFDVTEADMVERLQTTWAGTAPAQIVYGFRALGLEAEKVYRPDRDLAGVRPPAVLLVDFGGAPDAHAVAYMGRRGTLFEVWDPNSGRLALSQEGVEARWRGRAIEVRAPADPP